MGIWLRWPEILDTAIQTSGTLSTELMLMLMPEALWFASPKDCNNHAAGLLTEDVAALNIVPILLLNITGS
jgi:hypothetical protein